jgi:hypothetical protein
MEVWIYFLSPIISEILTKCGDWHAIAGFGRAGIEERNNHTDSRFYDNEKQEGQRRKGKGVLPRLESPVGSRFFQNWNNDPRRCFQVFPEGLG